MNNQLRRFCLLTIFMLLVTAAASAQQTADDYLKLGNEKYTQKDDDGAIRAYTECVRLSPAAEGCFFNRGLTYARKGNHPAAIADYTQAIRINPKNADVYIRRGIAYHVQKNYEMAIVDYQEALKYEPNNTTLKEALDLTKKLVAGGKEIEKAKADVAKAEAEEGDALIEKVKTAQPFNESGTRQLKDKDYDGAIQSFTKCLEAYPTYVGCLFGRGIAYGSKKNYDAALQDYTAVIQIAPDAHVYNRRAVIYRTKSDFDAAIKDYTKAIEFAPTNPDYFMERGASHYYKKEYDKALPDLSKAIQLKPTEAKYYYIRAAIYLDSNNRDAAIADFKKALEVNPNFSMAKESLQKLGVQP